MLTKKDLEKNGWTVVPDGVGFGVDHREAHELNILEFLTELLDLDPNAHGYDFAVCAYRKMDVANSERLERKTN
jgi:hypothetical protein